MSPANVNTSGGGQTITLTAHLADDLAGLAGLGYPGSATQVRFMSPSRQQFIDATFIPELTLISGTRNDGIYSSPLSVPRYAEQGTWTASDFLLVDQVGNQRSLTTAQMTAAGFATTFVVAGTNDVTPPELRSFSISLGVVSASSGGNVISTARLTDDLSGLAGAGYTSSPTQVRFRSPSRLQFVDGLFMPNLNLVSGTALDGTYQSQLVIPRFAEQGTWAVEQFLLVDQVGNMRTLTADQMRSLGFPTTFVVGP